MLPKQIVRDSPLSLILLERLPSEFPTEKISKMSLKVTCAWLRARHRVLCEPGKTVLQVQSAQGLTN